MTADRQPQMHPETLTKLPASPDEFGGFYRKLSGLRFPLEVAEILELRYLFNHAIDQAPEPSATPDYRHFRDQRLGEMERLGIDKPHHIERLLKLLTVLRELHLRHSLHSRDTERALRKAVVANQVAAKQSQRYSKYILFGLATMASFWLVLYQPGWWVYGGLGIGAYFSLDYLYSLSILKKERAVLAQNLEALLTRRVAALNWDAVVKNMALVLGYARLRGVEAFVLNEDDSEDLQQRHS